MSYKMEDIITWFLAKDGMSPKKLQKILYYAYSWYLTLENESVDELDNKLFDTQFEAWVHGPVIPDVYHMYRGLGYNLIPKYTGIVPQFDEDTEDVLKQVWDEYGHYTGNELETISHQESPWIEARSGYQPMDRCNEIITDENIFECYIQRIQ